MIDQLTETMAADQRIRRVLISEDKEGEPFLICA
jgi:hypothetical protein